jgi:hypothetical protein
MWGGYVHLTSIQANHLARPRITPSTFVKHLTSPCVQCRNALGYVENRELLAAVMRIQELHTFQCGGTRVPPGLLQWQIIVH